MIPRHGLRIGRHAGAGLPSWPESWSADHPEKQRLS